MALVAIPYCDPRHCSSAATRSAAILREIHRAHSTFAELALDRLALVEDFGQRAGR